MDVVAHQQGPRKKNLVINDDVGQSDHESSTSTLSQLGSKTGSELEITARLASPRDFLQGRPYILITIAVTSVTSFCFCSQILLRFSKISNLTLNRYYSRKRFDKQKLMTNTIL